jgi:hypothetical protein
MQSARMAQIRRGRANVVANTHGSDKYVYGSDKYVNGGDKYVNGGDKYVNGGDKYVTRQDLRATLFRPNYLL